MFSTDYASLAAAIFRVNLLKMGTVKFAETFEKL
jgi:hypothetical protein